MKLNKTSSYVLLELLNGHNTSAKVSERLKDVDIRSVQRAFERLGDLELVEKDGNNHPSYTLNYPNLLTCSIPDKLLEDEFRPETSINFGLIDWLRNTSPHTLQQLFSRKIDAVSSTPSKTKMSVKELEHLTIELSWKSSALEGNTYSLLDTQLLLTDGIKAKDKTTFETQMILNHKKVLVFIIENPELFTSNIEFKTLEEVHKLISYNLGIDSGVRKRLVKISASNYTPLAHPQKLRETANEVLAIISSEQIPFIRSLLALSLIPYLQIFEDGNKRTGRILANALLIHSANKGFSLRSVSAKQLAMAYLAFYEFNNLLPLATILETELAKH